MPRPAGDPVVHHVDEQRPLRALFGPLRAAALQAPGVRDDGVVGEDVVAVDVPEPPVVVAGRTEVLDRARRVGRVVGLRADRRVDDPDVQPTAGRGREAPREVRRRLPRRVADAVQRREPHPVPDDLVREHLPRGADDDPVGPPVGVDRLPPVERVVVAVHDERGDPGVAQPLQPGAHPQLRPQPPVGPVVQVTGEHDERDLLVQCQVDERVPRPQRGVPQCLLHVRRDPPEPGEGRVEVQVGGVEEAEGGHARRGRVRGPGPDRIGRPAQSWRRETRRPARPDAVHVIVRRAAPGPVSASSVVGAGPRIAVRR
ncbi:unannotated protein [freshwater metagenome]|uniref:Unannotated protein n=1 Tax=freshwater metagenome TaxID=449393 RepID=A0A6J7KFP2_9ZZZZ